MFKNLKTSTTTIVGSCDCLFDIDVIFNEINIDDEIIKIKCNDKEKTKDKEIICKTFYNQITIHFNDNINLKLFNNGKFQITGVKNQDTAYEKLDKFLTQISIIKGVKMVKPVRYNEVYIYKNKIIKPYEDGYVCDNLVKNKKILIENKLCESFSLIEGILIQKSHVNKEKKLYNCFGENIGKVIYHMIRKNKNLCLKNTVLIKNEEDNSRYDILKSVKYPNKIGELEIVLHSQVTFPVLDKEVKLYFSCCSATPTVVEKKVANTNFNLKLPLVKDEFFDRELFCSLLHKRNISFLYEPSKYPGVKINILDTKITIFRTGSILFSKKNEHIDIEEVLNFLQELFDSEILIKKKQEIKNEENNITIWDLM